MAEPTPNPELREQLRNLAVEIGDTVDPPDFQFNPSRNAETIDRIEAILQRVVPTLPVIREALAVHTAVHGAAFGAGSRRGTAWLHDGPTDGIATAEQAIRFLRAVQS